MSKINCKQQKSALSFITKGLMVILLSFLTSCVSNTTQSPQITPFNDNSASVTYKVDGEYQDVKENLIMAIENKGAVISYTAHSSEMLNRTAITLNITKTVYQDAEIVLFCKAELSHKMVQADPHSLVLCPYPIAIYTLKNETNIVYLSIRKPPQSLESYQAVFRLLVEIITETIDE